MVKETEATFLNERCAILMCGKCVREFETFCQWVFLCMMFLFILFYMFIYVSITVYML